MIGNPNLTMQDERALATYPGQAHFADPKSSHTCRECTHWLSQGKDRTQILRPSPCRKAFKANLLVPHQAKACRHFEDNPFAPAV